jgi:hypothetical protein
MRNFRLQSDERCSIYVLFGVLLCSPGRLFDIVKSHESAGAWRASSAGGRAAECAARVIPTARSPPPRLAHPFVSR